MNANETTSVEALTRRLAALESSNRQMRSVLAVTLVILFTLPLLSLVQDGKSGATKPADPSKAQNAQGGAIKATSILLIDKKGKLRGSWSVDEFGFPSFKMFDKRGTPRSEFTIDDSESLFVLRDGKGKNRIGMAIDAADYPHLLLSDAGQKPRIHFAIGRSGAPSMVMIHSDGTMPAGMGLSEQGQPWAKPGHPILIAPMPVRGKSVDGKTAEEEPVKTHKK